MPVMTFKLNIIVTVIAPHQFIKSAESACFVGYIFGASHPDRAQLIMTF